MTAVSVCRHKCSGRRKCSCDGNVAHEQHICSNPDCVCHSAAAFGLVKAVKRDGREVYESAPRELAVVL